ncbi:hypothetical protein BV20DRAFT_948116 [Pilatotrama ljubarskyi]|nr:hypothetical protein BV20DRAFT_948116 [Pilatotrama ljubarskyi]
MANRRFLEKHKSKPPPWPIARHPDGSIDYLGIPAWLQNLPELQERGIVLSECLKPYYVYSTNTNDHTAPTYVVKLLEPDTEEGPIYERLGRDPQLSKYTVPFEIIKSTNPRLLVMPYVEGLAHSRPFRAPLSAVMDVFLQMVEAVALLHDRKIVHLDICPGNALRGGEYEAKFDKRIVPGRMYIIDYHHSRQLQLGPGEHPTISLPLTQVPPPLDMEDFDPYSWDVYCLAFIWGGLIKVNYSTVSSPPWAARRIHKWLLGNERGCTTICRCRPTARQVFQILTVVRCLCAIVELSGRIIQHVSSLCRWPRWVSK